MLPFTKTTFLVIFTTASLFSVYIVPVSAQVNTVQTRQQEFLNILSSIPSNTYNVWRSEAFRYTAQILNGQNITQATNWFKNDSNLIANEWEGLILLRSYHALKNNTNFASSGAKANVEDYIKNALHDEVTQDNNKWKVPSHGKGSENHVIVKLSIQLLVEEFTNSTGTARYADIESAIVDWVREKSHRGYTEYFSPHYTERIVAPIMNIYDYSTNQELNKWAEIALDQITTNYLISEINGFRGGAMRRFFQENSGNFPNSELTDGRNDSMRAFGYILFDNTDLTPINYRASDQMIGMIYYATTSYRPSEVIYNIVDYRQGKNLITKSARRWEHEGTGKADSNAFIYVYSTDHYILSSIRIPDDQEWAWDPNDPIQEGKSFYAGINNGVPYQISFNDPTAMVGTKRSNSDVYETNPFAAAALFQHENVVLYKGFLDTYETVDLAVSTLDHEEASGQLKFYREAGLNGEVVYIGARETNGVGVMEVKLASDYNSWTAFKNDFSNNSVSLVSRTNIEYTSTNGDAIDFNDSSNVSVNGQSVEMNNWKLYESDFINGNWLGNGDAGVVTIGNSSTGTLVLDTRDVNNPSRTENPDASTPTPSMCTLVGDANCDGSVDLVDFQIWISEYSNENGFSSDFDSSGVVDLVDFEIWRSNSTDFG